MKRLLTCVMTTLILLVLHGATPHEAVAQEVTVDFFLTPVEQVGIYRGPSYFQWRFGTGTITANWSAMDYGFLSTMLILSKDIAPTDKSFLEAQSDVYTFPSDLDTPVTDPAIDTFFEGLHIPTDWLTPSTTYRELLRQLAGMFAFNQRYGGISGGESVFGQGVTLETRWNSLTAQQQAWFIVTLESFGWASGVPGNQKLRSLVKSAGSIWDGTPFVLGGVEF